MGRDGGLSRGKESQLPVLQQVTAPGMYLACLPIEVHPTCCFGTYLVFQGP